MGGLVQICKIHSWKSTTWALVTCMAWLSVFRVHIREETTKLFGTWIILPLQWLSKRRSNQKTGRWHKIKIELRSPETDKASENRPFQKEHFSSSNHWFSGAMFVSGRMDTKIESVYSPIYGNPSCSIGNASRNSPFPFLYVGLTQPYLRKYSIGGILTRLHLENLNIKSENASVASQNITHLRSSTSSLFDQMHLSNPFKDLTGRQTGWNNKGKFASITGRLTVSLYTLYTYYELAAARCLLSRVYNDRKLLHIVWIYCNHRKIQVLKPEGLT